MQEAVMTKEQVLARIKELTDKIDDREIYGSKHDRDFIAVTDKLRDERIELYKYLETLEKAAPMA